jgi:opacity protein-like surface antigen
MKHVLTALTLAAALASTAQAAVPVVYSAIGGTAGITDVSKAGDGHFPPNFTYWQTDTAFWSGFNESITFSFDQAYKLTGLKLNVDHNDYYRVYVSTNGSDWDTYATVLAFDGAVNDGMETFTLNLPPTALAYSFAKVTALPGGDELNAVGEVQFWGTTVTPVPEPESYAMLLAGLGVMAAITRRRSGRKAH